MLRIGPFLHQTCTVIIMLLIAQILVMIINLSMTTRVTFISDVNKDPRLSFDPAEEGTVVVNIEGIDLFKLIVVSVEDYPLSDIIPIDIETGKVAYYGTLEKVIDEIVGGNDKNNDEYDDGTDYDDDDDDSLHFDYDGLNSLSVQEKCDDIVRRVKNEFEAEPEFIKMDMFYVSSKAIAYGAISTTDLCLTRFANELWGITDRFIVVVVEFKGEFSFDSKDYPEMATETKFRIFQSKQNAFSYVNLVESFKIDGVKSTFLNPISISSAVESFLNSYFYKDILQKTKFKSSYACAESLSLDQNIESCELIDYKEKQFWDSIDFKPDESIEKNFIIFSINYAFRRILLCSSCCHFCGKKLSVSTLKPSMCPEKESSLCYFQASQREANDQTVEHAVLHEPYLLDLLISLASAAASKYAMEVFPTSLSCTQVIVPTSPLVSQGSSYKFGDSAKYEYNAGERIKIFDGEKQFFVTITSAQEHIFALDRPINPDLVIGAEVYIERNFYTKQSGKKYKELFKVLDKIPSVRAMADFSKSEKSLKNFLDNIDCLIYPLLKWIYKTNLAVLRMNTASVNKVFINDGAQKSFVEFFIHMGSVEKEYLFQKLNNEAIKKGKLPLLGFHGSPLCNWHDILRNGLNFNKVSHGRSYGNGVYHADTLDYSLHYSKNTGGGWNNSIFEMNGVVTVSEIVNDAKHIINRNPIVVNDVNAIQSRYLLIYGKIKDGVSIPVRNEEAMPRYVSENAISYYGNTVKIPYSKSGLFREKAGSSS